MYTHDTVWFEAAAFFSQKFVLKVKNKLMDWKIVTMNMTFLPHFLFLFT